MDRLGPVLWVQPAKAVSNQDHIARIKYVICTRIVRIFSGSFGASIGVVILSLNGKDGALRVKGARELSIGHCCEHPPAAYAFIRQSSARSEPNASAAGPSV